MRSSTCGCRRRSDVPANGAAPRGLVAGSGSWVGPEGWGQAGTPQVRPCRLSRAIHGADTPPGPSPPASDSSLRRPPTQEKKEEQKQKQKQKRPDGRFFHARRTHERSDPLLLLIFFFFSVGWPHTETVRGRAGWVRGGVRGMDAAAKPTGTYLRRPPRTQPARPNHMTRSTRPTHEGLRRWPETHARARNTNARIAGTAWIMKMRRLTL